MGKHQSDRIQVIRGETPDRAVGSLGHLGYLTQVGEKTNEQGMWLAGSGPVEKDLLCAIMTITAGVDWASL